MAQEELKLQLRGLETAGNPFSEVGEGSLSAGDNLLLRAKGAVEPRRGFSAGTGAIQGTLVNRLAVFQGQLFGFTDTGHLQQFGYNGNAGADVASGFSPPDAANPIRTALANKSLFFTTSTGVKKLESASGTPRDAGAIAPVLIEFNSMSLGAGGMGLQPGYSVSYRAVLARYDANNYLILSPPSPPLVITNTNSSAAAEISLLITFSPAPDTTGNWVFLLFRTASSPSGVYPGDECFQVFQSGEIFTVPATNTAGVIDSTPDSFLGSTPLYTNANTGDGTSQANDPPPLAKDICLYRDFLLYANTTQRQSLEVALLGAGGSGINVGDTFTIFGSAGSVVFTGSATTTSYASKQFKVVTSGTAAANIEATARNICDCITRWFAITYSPGVGGFTCSPLAAIYASGPLDNPGYIVFQELGIGGSGFSIQSASNGDTAFSPPIGTSPEASDNDVSPARLYYSKEGLPAAVPADVNYLDVGSADDPILRIITLRETCFIFKQRDGVFVLTGTTPDTFDVRPFDPTVRLIAPETAVALANSVFCLTNKGVLALNESGVSPNLAAAIKLDLDAVVTSCPNYSNLAFAVAYEDEGLYVLALPSTSSDTACTQEHVFSAINPGWTRWTLPSLLHGLTASLPKGGGVNTPMQLYLSASTSAWAERKTFTAADYVDPSNAAIACTLTLNPLFAGDPTAQKTWQTAILYFLAAGFSSCTLTASSDNAGSTSMQTVAGPGTPTSPWKLRYDFSQSQAQSCAVQLGLAISTNATFWRLAGLKVTYDDSAQVPQRS